MTHSRHPYLLYTLLPLLLVLIPPFRPVHSREVYTGLVNKQVTRTIDLTSQLSRHSVELNILNSGSKSAQHLYLAIKTDFAQKLSSMTVTQSLSGTNYQLDTKREDNHDNTKEYTLYRSLLRTPLNTSDSADVVVALVFTHTMVPFPSEITQSERQLVRYSDNHYWFSVYRTESVKTKIKLSSSSVQSNSELSPSSVKADVVSYGPYKDVAPLSYSPLSLHFENNKPFVTVKYVQRWIEVSHWGNIAVEEQYKVKHEGAKLKGSFSRYDFQINAQANGQAAVQYLRQFLPDTATDVYYRDDIGNISTSALRPGSPQTFDMRPRFPLFGDWKTEFTVGYNVPTSPFLATLASDTSRYLLTFPFMADWEAGTVVDTQVLKIVLPEGAKDLTVNVPFDVDVTYDRTVTYLDVISVGRPVVVLTKHNLVNDHNVNFQIGYTFASSSMFFEIFLLIGGFFVFFVGAIIVLRVELPIEDSKAGRTDDEKVVKLLSEISDTFTQRAEYHTRLSDALDNYIKSNDDKSWDSERKAVVSKFNDLKKKVSSALTQLGAKDGESVSKLSDIEKKQAEKELLQTQLIDSIIKHKVKKLSKGVDHETEREELTARYEDKQSEIEEDLEDFFGI